VTADLTAESVTFATPKPVLSSGVIGYAVTTQLQWLDPDTGFTDVNKVLRKLFMSSQIDPWLTFTIGNLNPVSAALSSGVNLINVMLPGLAIITLSNNPKFVDNWYKTNDIAKYGFARTIGSGFKSRPYWINYLSQTITFDVPDGEQVEVVLAEGITGSIKIYQYAGVFPTLWQGYGSNQSFYFYGGWNFYGQGNIPGNAKY
jgi:hypothetical protein